MMIEIHNPELELLIRERLRAGGFSDIGEVLIQALRSSAVPEQLSPKPKKNLAQFLLESPLPGSELTFERQKDYPGSLDL
jgi:hypothetical protein